jgi:putative protein-disulfide isomerase
MPETTADEAPRPRLLYFADTMCSWCYGFSPEMQAVLEALDGEVDLLLFSGGLRPFNAEPVDDKLRGYLSETYPRIAELSGQPFNAPRSLMPGFIYDTEPASRAVVCMRNLAPGREFAYMQALQRAFYNAGEDITKGEVLAEHASAQGLERAAFLEAFASEEMRAQTLADFEVARNFSLNGFPALIVHRVNAEGKDELVLVSQGYEKATGLIERIRAEIED